MNVDLQTELHIVASIPQSCDCSETLCVKLLQQDDLSHLSQTERIRVWTLRARDGKNWLDYGVSNERNIAGYVLMPLKVKLPDDVVDEEESRAWTCASCGAEVEKTYTELVDQGKPRCDTCEQDMVLVRPPDPESEAAEGTEGTEGTEESAAAAPAPDERRLPANETPDR